MDIGSIKMVLVPISIRELGDIILMVGGLEMLQAGMLRMNGIRLMVLGTILELMAI